MQRFLPNNIADFGELELSQANFTVLERSNLGHLLQELSLAYNLGDVEKARKTMQVGKLKTTKWIVKFDILKAEQIAENREGFEVGRSATSSASWVAARVPLPRATAAGRCRRRTRPGCG